jgi:hypothetical protein
MDYEDIEEIPLSRLTDIAQEEFDEPLTSRQVRDMLIRRNQNLFQWEKYEQDPNNS